MEVIEAMRRNNTIWRGVMEEMIEGRIGERNLGTRLKETIDVECDESHGQNKASRPCSS